MNRLSFANLNVVRTKAWKLENACTKALDRFNREESGVDIIEKLLILFICVVILIALATYFNSTIWDSLKTHVENLLGITPS